MVTTGDITASILDYNAAGNVHNANCAVNAAPCERLKICVQIDKDSYNNAIIADDKVGNFDSNIRSAGVLLTSNLPSDNDTPIFTPLTPTINNDTTYEVCYTFRVPEEWQGSTNFVVFQFTWNVGGVTEPIWYSYSIGTSPLSTTDITINTVTDAAGEPIDGDVVCIDETNCINIGFTAAPNRSVLAVAHVGNATQEFNGYVSPNLPQEQSSVIKSIILGNLSVNTAGLQEGECCVKLITKPDAQVTVEPIQCDCIDVTLSQRPRNCNSSQSILDWVLFLDFALVGNLANVTLSTAGGELNQTFSESDFTNNAAGFFVDGNFTFPAIDGDVNYTLIVNTNEGCCYTRVFDLNIDCDTNTAGFETVEICSKNNPVNSCDISVTATMIDAACGGLGSATAVVTGGTAPFTYSWSNGQTTETAIDLEAGNYVVTVTDANDCEEMATVTIVSSPEVTATCTSTPSNGDDGAIILTVETGTAPYAFAWTGPDDYTATTQNISDLETGVYTVAITDANGCEFELMCAVSQTDCPDFILDISAINPLCNGSDDGEIIINSIDGGVAPYTFNWSNGDSNQNIDGLGAGTYTLIMADQEGCMHEVSVTLTQPDLLEAECFATAGNGANDASISLTVTGGTPNYTYAWTGPNGFVSIDKDITGLEAGNYTVVITDNNGCTLTLNCQTTEPNCPSLLINFEVTNVLCDGQNDAEIIATVTGGQAPYTYLWDNGATTSTINNLSVGQYILTVTDANGCEEEAGVIITGSTPIALNAIITDESPGGATDGAINLTVTGGAAPYTYNWSNGATTASISNLSAGTYTVTVTDDNGCSITATYEVLGSGCPTIGATSVTNNVSCNGGNDGSITISNITGGAIPYSYSWSNGATSQNLNNVAAGTYTLTISDANNCTAVLNFSISEPSALLVTCTSTNESAAGANDGSIEANVTGGTAPYSYSWSNGATTQDISNLAGGSYILTVTDANGCTQSLNCIVTTDVTACPTFLVFVDNSQGGSLDCFGDSDGFVNTVIVAGAAPHTFFWTGPNGYTSTVQSPSGLSGGTYSVLVTDANGCTQNAGATISEPNQLVPNCNSTDDTGGGNGTATINATGGVGSRTYLWSNGATTQTITGLSAGTYTATVTDSNGCSASCSVVVAGAGCPTLSVSISSNNVTCFGFSNGSATATLSAGSASPISYLWSNGATTQTISGLTTGFYSVTATDANGCAATGSVTITQPSQIIASCTTTGDNGSGNGSVNLTVSGGVGGYSYTWSNGATTQDLSNVSAGTYTVTITDANGCTATESCTVSSVGCPTLNTAFTNVEHVTCFGGSDGQATALMLGPDTPPITCTWVGPNGFTATGATITGLSAGLYTASCTDANGCSDTSTLSITEPAELMASCQNATGESAPGANDGSVTLSATGGSPAYLFNWTGPNGFSSITASISNLAPGNYTGTVTDTNGCTDSITCVISAATCGTVNISVNPTNISCFGLQDGSITSSGPSGAFTATWTGPNGFTATGANISNLAAGTYTVTWVEAGTGCTGSNSATVIEPAQLSASITANPTTYCDPNGAGTADPIGLSANVFGGTAPYTYTWTSNGVVNTGQSISIPYPSTGWQENHSLTVTDANGCTAMDSIVLDIFRNPNVVAFSNSPICKVTGALIQLDATGAATYSWTGPNGFTSNIPNPSTDVMNYPVGNNIFTVTGTSSDGCSSTVSVTVEVLPTVTITATASPNPAQVGDNVQLTAIPNPSGASVDYLWLGPNNFFSTSQNPVISNIQANQAGNYTLQATFDDTCQVTTIVNVIVN